MTNAIIFVFYSVQNWPSHGAWLLFHQAPFFPLAVLLKRLLHICDNSSVAAIATHCRLAMIQSAVLIDHNNEGRLQWLPVESHDWPGG